MARVDRAFYPGSISDTPSPASRFAKSHAVVIGIDAYSAGVPVLQNAVGDARAIAAALQRDQAFAVSTLFDGEATSDALKTLVTKALPARVGRDDRLLVYIASHGLSISSEDGPAGYLLFSDAERDRPETFLPMRALHDALAALPCRHLLVVLDCCFAGAFRWAAQRNLVVKRRVFRETYDRFVESPAWQVLTSSASDQSALDAFGDRAATGNHSPFAKAFLDGLAGAADMDGDGLITAAELYWFVRGKVERATDTGILQSPGLFPLRKHERGEFVFRTPTRPLALDKAPALTREMNPYRGLESYDENSREYFFGRETVMRALAKKVLAGPLTVVTGTSGCGKSSVIKAGLVPLFRAAQERTNERRRWAIVGPLRAIDAMRGKLPDLPLAGHVLVVIDQLEDLVTQAVDVRERMAFLEGLATWIADERVRLVVSIRSDFEPQVRTGLFANAWRSARFVVPPMTQDQLRRAIEQPAAAREIYFKPAGIVDDLINEVVQMPGALPLLSFTLSELYRNAFERHADDRAITATDVDAVGGVTRALTMRASAVLDQLIATDPAYAITARVAMLRLVTSAGGELARRRAVLRDDLDFADEAQNRRVERLVDVFITARLLVTDTDPSGTAYVEPAHDGLIRGWDRLAVWLKESEAVMPTVRAIGTAAAVWKQNRDAGYLWHADPRLPQAVELRKSVAPALNRSELEFIDRSQRRRRRRIVVRSLAVTSALIVLAVVALVAWVQRNIAQSALKSAETSQRRVSQQLAVNYLEEGRRLLIDQDRPMRALPYLLEARRLGLDTGTLRMLFHQAQRARPPTVLGDGTGATFLPFDDSVLIWDSNSVRIAGPDGSPEPPVFEGKLDANLVGLDRAGKKVVLVTGERRVVVVVDIATRALQQLPHDRDVRQVQLDAAGRHVVTVDDQQVARVWSVETGRTTVFGSRATRAWFVPGDRLLISTSNGIELHVLDGNRPALWHRDTGALSTQLDEKGNHVELVAGPTGARVSPDGNRVVTQLMSTFAMWELDAGLALGGPLRQDEAIEDVRFSPDGQFLALLGVDGRISIRTVIDGAPHLSLPVRNASAFAYSASGRFIATAGSDGFARLYDTTIGMQVAAFEHAQSVLHAEVSSNGSRVLTTSFDRVVRVWPVQHWFGHVDDRDPEMPLAKDSTAVVSRTGSTIAWLDDSDTHLRQVWDVVSRKAAPTRVAPDVALAPDGLRAVERVAQTVRVVTLATGETTKGIPVGLGSVQLGFGVEGPFAIEATTISDALTGARTPIEGHSESAAFSESAVFSSISGDAARVLRCFRDRQCEVLEARTGKRLVQFETEELQDAMVNTDGRYLLLVVKHKGTQIREVARGIAFEGIPATSNLGVRPFTEDFDRLVFWEDDGAIRIRSFPTGAVIAPAMLTGTSDRWSATFTRDGARVIASGDLAYAWDFAEDRGSLDEWQRHVATCSLWKLENVAVVPNKPGPCPVDTAASQAWGVTELSAIGDAVVETEPEIAIRVYDRALAMAPDEPMKGRLRAAKAVAAMMANDENRALSILVETDRARARSNLAHFALDTLHHPRATLAIIGNAPELVLERVVALVAAHRLSEAFAEGERAARSDPDARRRVVLWSLTWIAQRLSHKPSTADVSLKAAYADWIRKPGAGSAFDPAGLVFALEIAPAATTTVNPCIALLRMVERAPDHETEREIADLLAQPESFISKF